VSRAVLSIALLTGVYALMLSSVHPLDLALGAVLSALAVFGLRRFLFPGGLTPVEGLGRRIAGSAGLIVAVLRDVVVGTWEVALVVVGRRPAATPGIVELPAGDRTEMGAIVAAMLATLSPGEFVLDFDFERGVVLMHVLDASDPEAVRERWRETYRRHQRAVWP
jgi:multisubunit Na+/H+ antiporter MnhE subunit